LQEIARSRPRGATDLPGGDLGIGETMKVTKAELRDLADRNDTWKDGKGDHPTLFISDDLFDRVLDDLHELARVESGQTSILDVLGKDC
jgi:hypothetical protein